MVVGLKEGGVDNPGDELVAAVSWGADGCWFVAAAASNRKSSCEELSGKRECSADMEPDTVPARQTNQPTNQLFVLVATTTTAAGTATSPYTFTSTALAASMSRGRLCQQTMSFMQSGRHWASHAHPCTQVRVCCMLRCFVSKVEQVRLC